AGTYATFAADGMKRKPHFIAKVTNADGGTVAEGSTQAEPAFDSNSEKNAQIARNVTHSLEPVLTSSKLTCSGGQFCAGKTGTHELANQPGQNSHTWMAGYSAQISTAVWVGNKDGELALKDKTGAVVWGRTLPGSTWQKFMNAYLAGKK